jgi:hypothetical protein
MGWRDVDAMGKKIKITFVDEPSRIDFPLPPIPKPSTTIALPAAIREREPEPSDEEKIAYVDGLLKSASKKVFEALKESLLDEGSHASEEVMGARREGDEIAATIEFSDAWEGTVTARMSVNRAYDALKEAKECGELDEDDDEDDDKS